MVNVMVYAKLIRKIIMSRPNGSIDAKKRKIKKFLNNKQEQELIIDYRNNLPINELIKKYDISKSYILSTLKRKKEPRRLDRSITSKWKNIDIEYTSSLSKDICGIYAIYFYWNHKLEKYNPLCSEQAFKLNDIKVYIGSSVCIRKRLLTHKKDLEKNQHINSSMLEYFNKPEYICQYAIVEECEEKDLLQKEGEIIRSISKSSILNSWAPQDKETVEPWLSKAVSMDAYTKNYVISTQSFYDGTPCKETKHAHKSGYGHMSCKIGDKVKYFSKHRLAYWDKYGEYPELVRHLCNNRKCYNPDHLATGSHRENGLDKRGDFPKKFENKWLEYNGNIEKLTQEFDWKPGGNSVYFWEKELDLRNKYPEIINDRMPNKFTEEEKDFVRSMLDTKTFNEIYECFMTKYEKTISRQTVDRLGGCISSVQENKYKEIYDFIRVNLNNYCDSELCNLINIKFDLELSRETFITLRFNQEIYRCNIIPKNKLKRKDSTKIYCDVEIKEFLRENYLNYTDEELAVKALEGKLFDVACFEVWPDIILGIKTLRLKDYGFVRENETPIPLFVDSNGKNIYMFELDIRENDSSV